MTATMKVTNLQNESSATPNIVLNADGTTTIPTQSTTNLSYTGTLTGGTGVINIGSGQVYKDASGNVGIGTASPVSLFHVNSASASAIATVQSTTFALFRSKNASRSVDYGSDGTGGYIDIGNAPFRFFNGATQAMTLSAAGNLGIGVSPDADAKLQVEGGIRATSGSPAAFNMTNGFSFKDSKDAGMFSPANGVVGFATAGTERARIDTNGNLLVGTQSAGFSSTTSLVLDKAGGYLIVNHLNTAGGTGYALFGYNGTGIGSITQNGTSNVSYNTTSDYRLKENVQPMQNALATVAALKPCTYTWKADGSAGQGFIAHELQAVVPDCVTGEKDAVDADGNPKYQGVDTSFLVATLTAALQEQQAIITQLQADVAALKGVA